MREQYKLGWQRDKEGKALQAQQPMDARALRQDKWGEHSKKFSMTDEEGVTDEKREAGTIRP